MFGWLSGRKDRHGISSDTPISSIRFVVLDTELTSLDRKTNRLLSVGAIKMDGAKILVGDQFYNVVNPGVGVPASTVVIHGLRPNDVQGAEPTAKVLNEFRAFVGDAVLVGHFIGIDGHVLRKEFAEIGASLHNALLCTARTHKWIVTQERYSEDHFDKLEKIDLASLAKMYGIEVQQAHHALDDAFVTARLWQKMLFRLEKLGVSSFGKLHKIAASRD